MPTQIRRFSTLLALAGLMAVSADFACNDDACPTERAGRYQTLDDVGRQRVELYDEAIARLGAPLLAARLDRPVKFADGHVEMPAGWLPEIPEGHPWRAALTPDDDAFYSWFEERVLSARLYNPASPQHVALAQAYLAKAATASPRFVGWTFASPTECPKKMIVK